MVGALPDSPVPGHPGSLAGGGELGALVRAKDWSATPLGSPGAWSRSVTAAVSLCLNSRFPMVLFLGPELRLVYNDAYVPFLGGAKHPAALGAPAREAWAEIWGTIGPLLDEALAGEATWVEDFQLFLDRRLPREEVYFTFSYSPVFGDDGRTVEGVFSACTETTEWLVSERRLSTLRHLGLRTSDQRTAEAACRDAAGILDGNPWDIAFAAIYLNDEAGRTAGLVAGTRLPDAPSAFPAACALSGDDAASQPWPFGETARTRKAVEVPDLPDRVGMFAAPLWPDPVQTALVIPMADHGAPKGFLVVGTSPRRVLDADYRAFLALAAERIAATVAEARAFEGERRRVEALAELDRAKTAYFSNVSHEFRTPLTLMLAPLEQLLGKPEGELPADGRALAAVAHRNGLRLLKLVNTLLDFSRIEAERARADYEPTDLGRLTAELASGFRSACERAGLALDIACEPLPEPVWVDRDMWEKVVLNLLSNAYKFTFEGGIAVRLAATAAGTELRVSDTGVGIPTPDLLRVFERFHRVEGQRGRSFEGSGIGLALVRELVRLHGGTIAVDSEVGRGTTFTVEVPFGTTHLPQGRPGGRAAVPSTSTRAEAYVEEALGWLPGDGRADGAARRDGAEDAAPAGRGERILLADDNADMREYLARLLSARGWEVEAVEDGQAVLEAARRRRPDLVLSDVMMPRLDGLGLAAELRRDPRFAEVPIVLVSARAGMEARVEGLEAGADDHLVKPFAARELLARVASNLALARLRRDAADQVRRSEARLQAAVDLVGLSPYDWDPATGALEWDDRLRAMWGLPAGAQVDAKVFLSGVHPEDRARVEAAMAACVDPRGDGIYQLEYRVVGIGDGEERWASTHGRTFFEDGRAVGFVGAALDITGRKRAEEQLRASEERFRRFAEHSTGVLWIADVEAMRLDYLSPAFGAVAGRPPEAALGDLARWAETVHPDDRTGTLEAFERVRQGEVVTQEYRIVRPDGAVRWIRDTCSRSATSGGGCGRRAASRRT